MLVVLDNFEQVLEAAPQIGVLLQRAPRLTVLATSREPLRVEGEREYAVPPLAADDALAFFTERARAVDDDFALNGEEHVAR